MNRFAQIENGIVVALTESDGEIVGDNIVQVVSGQSANIGDNWDGSEFTAPAPAVRTRLTRLEYRNQFTLQEKAAMYAAAKTDDIVQVLIDDVGAAEYIELTEATTQQGVGYLAQIGVIAPERAPEILTGIVE